jgi:hypothetical protein
MSDSDGVTPTPGQIPAVFTKSRGRHLLSKESIQDILMCWDMSVHEGVMSGNGVLFLGWFGPIGAAALCYAAYSLRETGIEEVWVVGSLVICASVVIHGVTATPFHQALRQVYPGRIRDTLPPTSLYEYLLPGPS